MSALSHRLSLFVYLLALVYFCISVALGYALFTACCMTLSLIILCTPCDVPVILTSLLNECVDVLESTTMTTTKIKSVRPANARERSPFLTDESNQHHRHHHSHSSPVLVRSPSSLFIAGTISVVLLDDAMIRRHIYRAIQKHHDRRIRTAATPGSAHLLAQYAIMKERIVDLNDSSSLLSLNSCSPLFNAWCTSSATLSSFLIQTARRSLVAHERQRRHHARIPSADHATATGDDGDNDGEDDHERRGDSESANVDANQVRDKYDKVNSSRWVCTRMYSNLLCVLFALSTGNPLVFSSFSTFSR
jgi:hypothetical protein